MKTDRYASKQVSMMTDEAEEMKRDRFSGKRNKHESKNGKGTELTEKSVWRKSRKPE